MNGGDSEKMRSSPYYETFGWEQWTIIRVISSESGGLYMTQGVSKGSRHVGSRGNWGQTEHSVQLDADGECGRSTYEEAPRI